MTTPTPSAGNPGRGAVVGLAFSNKAGESCSETVDLSVLLKEALQAEGHAATQERQWLHLDNGFWLLPQFVSCDVRPNNSASTTSTIEINHTALAPDGLFEYQHAAHKDGPVDSFRYGLAQWIKTDAVALFDSARTAPQNCTTMEMTFPGKNGEPGRSRRVVLGPVSYVAAQPEANPPQGDAHPPFCPCCFLTNSFDTFKALIESSGYVAIRMFAARDNEGKISADCRGF